MEAQDKWKKKNSHQSSLSALYATDLYTAFRIKQSSTNYFSIWQD